MMMRMNASFAERWRSERLDHELPAVVLEPRLGAIIAAPLVRTAGGLVLEPLATHATGSQAFQDITGYEAFINKIHVDDLVPAGGTRQEQFSALIRQGVKAAVELSLRLEREGRFRILLSVDPDLPTATLRFFGRRQGEAWGVED